MRKKLKPEYVEVLKRIQAIGYVDAVIAGGAVRDAYFDRTPADVDIFVSGKDITSAKVDFCKIPKDRASVMHLLSGGHTHHLDALHKMAGQSDGEYSKQREWLLSGWDYISYKDIDTESTLSQWTFNNVVRTTYQIIVIDRISPKQYVEQYFDIGLCQCWHDGTKMMYTSNFLQDASNKTLTVCGKMSEKELEYVRARHLPKLQKKFPGFTPVIAPNIV